jgi:hypothetical protein
MVRKHPSENNGRGGSPSGPKIQVRSAVWVDTGGLAEKMGRLRPPARSLRLGERANPYPVFFDRR